MARKRQRYVNILGYKLEEKAPCSRNPLSATPSHTLQALIRAFIQIAMYLCSLHLHDCAGPAPALQGGIPTTTLHSLADGAVRACARTVMASFVHKVLSTWAGVFGPGSARQLQRQTLSTSSVMRGAAPFNGFAARAARVVE